MRVRVYRMSVEAPLSLSNLIAGDWREGTGEEVHDWNPAKPSTLLASFRDPDESLIHAAVTSAVSSWPQWRKTPAPERGVILSRTANILEREAEDWGHELAQEEGKTLAEGVGEVQRAAEILRFFAGQTFASDGDTYPSPRERERIFTIRQPVGPVVVITPWNFPIAIPTWKIAPALAYGNTVVWKPAQLVPLLAVRLSEALLQAGLPPGVLNLVLGRGEVGSRLVRGDGIRACSFTGSNEVGRLLSFQSAEAGVKLQMELGGKNAVVVLSDADIDLAARSIVSGAMMSTGQKCTATSRAVVEEAVFEDVVDRVAELTSELSVGDPIDPTVDIGPLVSEAQLTSVLTYLDIARSEGATAVVGGDRLASQGFFVNPTVFVDVEPSHRIFREEVFGPVLAVIGASDPFEALQVANLGPFGLSGAIFTEDLGSVLRAIDLFDVGVLHVNSATTGADPHVPFGGVKSSGLGGREMGTSARDFYTETKTVYLQSPSDSPSLRV